VRLQGRGRVVFTAAIAGSVYAKHGTTIETRLTVIDKAPAEDPEHFPDPPASHPMSRRCSAGSKRSFRPPAVPDRAFRRDTGHHAAHGARLSRARGNGPRARLIAQPQGVPLAYETIDWTPPEVGRLSDAIYETYALQSIRIDGAQPHPTKLVQSAAMASVAPPQPSYRPMLPAPIVADGSSPTPSSRR
jgi:hypothetical protein